METVRTNAEAFTDFRGSRKKVGVTRASADRELAAFWSVALERLECHAQCTENRVGPLLGEIKPSLLAPAALRSTIACCKVLLSVRFHYDFLIGYRILSHFPNVSTEKTVRRRGMRLSER